MSHPLMLTLEELATSSKLVQGAVNEIGEIKREGHGSLPTPGHGGGAGGEKLWIG